MHIRLQRQIHADERKEEIIKKYGRKCWSSDNKKNYYKFKS